ncbi:hypothetical protein HY489_05275 [Candidatus Woesearchaeota archaeon]|nr:hypothetical protein [Candidatus Woesearchaeota archaeon]
MKSKKIVTDLNGAGLLPSSFFLLPSKKGIEFSIGMVVALIIGVLVFILSVNLLFKWFGSAQELEQEIDRQTQEQILQTLKSGNQLVVIPFTVVDAKRGAMAKFALGVRNIGAQARFGAILSFDEAYAPDGSVISQKNAQFVEQRWLGNFKSVPPFTLKKNQQEVRPLLIRADVNAGQGIPTQKGDYVFNVCVYKDEGQSPPECKPENRKQFYTEKVYQATVRVI